jgi:hypothetical protein
MFRRTKGIVVLTLDADESELLGQLFGQMIELLAPPDVPEHTDPLARLVGMDGPTEPPRDPALARLFPAGYRDDAAAAADFRRFTEPDLRNGKVMNARIAQALLEEWTGTRELTTDQAKAVMLAFNDMRLTLGTRIGIGEIHDDEDDEEVDDPAMHLYDWLTYLQGTLVDAISAST